MGTTQCFKKPINIYRYDIEEIKKNEVNYSLISEENTYYFCCFNYTNNNLLYNSCHSCHSCHSCDSCDCF